MPTCHICHQEIPAPAKGSITTGYGLDSDHHKICYACCAEQDKQWMQERGEILLYLTFKQEPISAADWRIGYRSGRITDAKLTNWPGSLEFKAGSIHIGRHNWGLRRYDTWFIGPDDHIWHAVRYGDNTEIAHCKRTKRTIFDK